MALPVRKLLDYKKSSDSPHLAATVPARKPVLKPGVWRKSSQKEDFQSLKIHMGLLINATRSSLIRDGRGTIFFPRSLVSPVCLSPEFLEIGG
jgi:hypothetical protein